MFFAIAIAIIPLVVAGRTMIRIAQDELKSSANEQLSSTAQQLTEEINDLYEHTWLAPLLLIRNAIDSDELGVQEKVALLTLGIAEHRRHRGTADHDQGLADPARGAQRGLRGASRGRLARARSRRCASRPTTIEAYLRQRRGLRPGRRPHPGDRRLARDRGAAAGLAARRRRTRILSARIDLNRLREFIAEHPLTKQRRLHRARGRARRGDLRIGPRRPRSVRRSSPRRSTFSTRARV